MLAVAALAASPANAALTSGLSQDDTLYVNSDAEADTIEITCVAGLVKVNGANIVPIAVSCAAPLTIVLFGGDGADRLDITGVDAAEWPKLVFTSLDGSGGPDTLLDTPVGSIGLSGILRGGPGDDLIVPSVSTEIEGGPGDDRIEGLGSQGAKPDGGEGSDELAIDLTAEPTANWTFAPRDSGLAYGLTGEPPTVAEWSSIERLDALLGDDDQIVDATGFSGSVRVQARGGADTLIGGPLADELIGGDGNDVLDGAGGADLLDGAGGNDVLEGAGGADLYAGGDGDDLIRARDEIADGGDCGPGTDTLIADAVDVLSACEAIELPPGPPTPPDPPPAPAPPATPSPLPSPPSGLPTVKRNPASVTAGWRVAGKRTTFTRMRIANVVAGTVVELRCTGAKCPFTAKRTTQARKGVIDGLALLGRRAHKRLRASQTLEVRVTAPGHLGKVVRYRIRNGEQPKVSRLCLPAGASKPQPRC